MKVELSTLSNEEIQILMELLLERQIELAPYASEDKILRKLIEVDKIKEKLGGIRSIEN